MASLIDSILGQQDVPELHSVSQKELLGSIFKSLPQLQRINDQWNMDMATGGAKAQLAGEKIYDPNRAAIRSKAGALINQQLDNPYAMPPELLALLRQQGFEGAAGSGLNTSNAGRTGVSSLLGRHALEYANNIINRGASYGANTANLYNPSAAITPSDAGSATLAANAQNNALNQYRSELDFQNTMNLINRPLQLTGEVDRRIGQWMGMFTGGAALNGGQQGSSIPVYGSGGGGSFNSSGVPPGQSASWVMPRGY